MGLPSHHQAYVMMRDQSGAKPAKVWHPASLQTAPLPTLPPAYVLVRVSAVSFNHRDLWSRRGLYPGLTFPSVLGSDCSGTVVAAESKHCPWIGKEVVVYPAANWNESPRAPDVPGKTFSALGGTKQTDGRGTFAEYVAVPEDYCVAKPAHLNDASAAALPLGLLTAWRALTVKGEVEPGMNVLVTGIGGGVALLVLQIALAKGAKVWVTSGNEEKIERAKRLGASGGVVYKDEDWGKKLKSLLPKERPLLDVVVDSGGGDIIQQVTRLVCDGGRFVCYGSATGEPSYITMGELLRNVEVRGSTMGSLAEFKEAVRFVSDTKLEPVVHTVLRGLDQLDKGFDIMGKGEQFGKIVATVEDRSKL